MSMIAGDGNFRSIDTSASCSVGPRWTASGLASNSDFWSRPCSSRPFAVSVTCLTRLSSGSGVRMASPSDSRSSVMWVM